MVGGCGGYGKGLSMVASATLATICGWVSLLRSTTVPCTCIDTALFSAAIAPPQPKARAMTT
jgi:hypothetical protein